MSRLVGEQMNRIKQVVERLRIRESDNCPEDTLTRQYGFVQFNDNEIDENTRLSQYIHLALKTDAETVVRFMREAWQLRTPDLIISIAGGAKHFDLSARLRKAFQLGLVSAAATTNAWIITAGTNAGVVKEVGQALNKYRYKNQKDGIDIPCIGIASWGYTSGNHQLDRSPSNSNASGEISVVTMPMRKYRYNLGVDAIQMSGDAIYKIQTYIVTAKEEKRCDLEPNHTHFLIFDDRTPTPENVLGLRADIEMYSRQINFEKTIEGAFHALIPIVMVLLEGGRSSIKTLCEALDANTPVVVVKDSGRAADLVAELLACLDRETVDMCQPYDEAQDDQLPRRPSLIAASTRANLVDGIFNRVRIHNAWVDGIRDELCRVLNERRQLLTIFDFDSEQYHGRLEEAILAAVFDAAKFSHQSDEQYRSTAELRLALAWHNVQYARRAIFTDSNISKWSNEDLRQGLVDALRRNHMDFIELFIEYGVALEKLTYGDLDYLYNSASIDTVLPLDNSQGNEVTRQEFYDEYLKSQYEICTDKSVPLGEHAARDLFFWAIFIDRFDFAIYLCSKTWNQTTALLFGARIYRKAVSLTLDSEMKAQYEKNASQLDKYAASIMDRCFENDRDFAVNILRKPSIAFYNVLPLKLALKANSRAFLASKCVQKYLDNEWFGNINYKRQNINVRIFLCCVFLPLLPFLCGTLPYVYRYQPFNPNSKVFKKYRNPARNLTSARRDVQWSEKVFFFYRAPIVRFYYNLIFFVVFLGLFSFVLLVNFFPLNIHHGHRSGIKDLLIPISEICLHICILGIIVEEFRQYFLMHSYVEYLDELSNWIDLCAICLYLIGFIARFIVNENFFTFSKIIFGLDLILWYIRILHLFAAYERLGPKLVMIFNTMKDLFFFVCFILIFLFGFSITSWSLIITSAQVKWIYDGDGRLVNTTISQEAALQWSWKLLRDVTNYGIWKVFGQVETIEGTDSYSAVAFVLAILFVTISNVLLLNVLVALFNVTIGNVRDQSHHLWRYQRFLLVNEFRNKSLLPPPFNIFHALVSVIIYCGKRFRKRYRNHTAIPGDRATIDVISSMDQPFKITESMKRECAIAEDFWRDLLKKLEEKSVK